MEPLLKQLRELPTRLMALPLPARIALIGGTVLALVVALAVSSGVGASQYQYAFTNLTPEDSAEAALVLKNAQVPYRLEAGGAALAVPTEKLYDARLLLATAGLPRGGGVGFELFDRGDLGVSEFTQKVNLRRAIEGELARTIGRLTEVRSARVHISLAEKGLFRDEDRKASAAVVLNLQPGRELGGRELAGIRHLVASAVPGLNMEAVTVVDNRGTVLVEDASWNDPAVAMQKKLERDLEQRVMSLLEPVVGVGAVVAKVTATMDSAQVTSNAEIYDPDQVAVRSERKVAANQNQDNALTGAIAGAAANTPLLPVNQQNAVGNRSASNTADEITNYEVSKTVTTTVVRSPRLKRLSVAVLLDGVAGKPRSEAEVARLGELARKAVGFDEQRGDQIEVSSSVFSSDDGATATAEAAPVIKPWMYAAASALLLLLLGGGFWAVRGRKGAPSSPPLPELVLEPGARVADLEARAAAAAKAQETPPALPEPEFEAPPERLLPDPAIAVRDRARELASLDPAKAAHLLRAWIVSDNENNEAVSNA